MNKTDFTHTFCERISVIGKGEKLPVDKSNIKFAEEMYALVKNKDILIHGLDLLETLGDGDSPMFILLTKFADPKTKKLMELVQARKLFNFGENLDEKV